jgi:hypothetical protein
MIGRRFGKLVVTRDSGKRNHKAILWECVCDCGNTTLGKTALLNSGKKKSCGCLHGGMPKGTKLGKVYINPIVYKNMGVRKELLTLVGFKKELGKTLMAVLKCDCGSVVSRPYNEFIKGRKKSCGCLSKEISRKAKEKKLVKEQNSLIYQYKPPRDITNKKFGKLTVLYWCGVSFDKHEHKHSLWYCKCECGKEIIKKSNAFKNKNVSCGCIFKGNRIKRALAMSDIWREKRYKKISDVGYIKEELLHKERRSNKTVRTRSFFKYGNKCLICGKEDSKKEPLCIHHLRPYWSYPMLRLFAINNIPLCRECHDELHKTFGYFELSPLIQWAYIDKHRGLLGVYATYRSRLAG